MKDRFRKIMTDHGLTQQKMAELIGIDTSTVSCFCSGKRQPGFEVIKKISSAFPDVDMNWFINGDNRAIGVAMNGSGVAVNGAGGAVGDEGCESGDRNQLSLNFNSTPHSGTSLSTGTTAGASTVSATGSNGSPAALSGATDPNVGSGSNLNSGVPSGTSGTLSGTSATIANRANLNSIASYHPGDYATTPSGRRQIKRVILFFEDGGIESYE